jgi:Lon protease-like protein
VDLDGKSAPSARYEERLSALPLFPLPGAVLFPNTLLPLHVFEPRYRQMTEHCLDGDGLMVIVKKRDDEDSADLSDVFEVGGLGRIVHHERLPDGRYHILLQGLARVRLVEELPKEGLLYRRARGVCVRDDDADAKAVLAELETLKACYTQVMHRSAFAQGHLGDLCQRVDDPGVLADVVCASVLEASDDRQAALEDACVLSRLKRASDALAALLLGEVGSDSPVH